MLSILVDSAAANEQLTVILHQIFHNTAKINGNGRNNDKEIFVMSCNFMSCNFIPCNFDDPSFSCASFSALPRLSVEKCGEAMAHTNCDNGL